MSRRRHFVLDRLLRRGRARLGKGERDAGERDAGERDAELHLYSVSRTSRIYLHLQNSWNSYIIVRTPARSHTGCPFVLRFFLFLSFLLSLDFSLCLAFLYLACLHLNRSSKTLILFHCFTVSLFPVCVSNCVRLCLCVRPSVRPEVHPDVGPALQDVVQHPAPLLSS